MSSGFVSAGTSDQQVDHRSDEWIQAQKELEEERKRKADISNQKDGKSLFEQLETNKMAKQEAFDEKWRLKNQFRSLDDDECEFLDSVLESTRVQEAAIKKDTADQLEAFRKQREEAAQALLDSTSLEIEPALDNEWSIPSRKRRREKANNHLLLTGKKRKASTGQESDQAEKKTDPSGTSTTVSGGTQDSAAKDVKQISANSEISKTDKSQSDKQPSKPASVSRPLVAYGSDSDSE
ncbi:hypothetical protein N7495_005607 [Penicillium taxi]|uniref:uncharacterized protein n=1 Tax=Penicillium taxi TaxID=168475 RepID=UPI002545BB9E|nr:uncharacterized protein N7495_005607 [Penicillium taxi]KAJ5893916.1 hypothetical protein N7495_005607 [Penicillium taxi]